MDENVHYWGRPCKHGHSNEEGQTLRYRRTTACVECNKKRLAEYNKTEAYKAYQREYHARLRVENPDKLIEYYNNRIRRGTAPTTKPRPLKSAHETVVENSQNKLAAMLLNNLKAQYFTKTGELSKLAVDEGYKTADEVEAALLIKAKLLVNPKATADK